MDGYGFDTGAPTYGWPSSGGGDGFWSGVDAGEILGSFTSAWNSYWNAQGGQPDGGPQVTYGGVQSVPPVVLLLIALGVVVYLIRRG